VINCFGLPHGQLGKRQPNALDLGGALTLSAPRTDRPPIAKPKFSFFEDIEAEWHGIVHSKLLSAKQKRPLSDLQRFALHGAAMVTGAEHLHERIDRMEYELEADMLLLEREALFVKDKVFSADTRPASKSAGDGAS